MQKFLRNPIYKMVAIFAVAYGGILLLGGLAGMENGYRTAMQSVSNKVFRNFWGDGLVFFQDGVDPSGKEMDTAITLVNRKAFVEAQQNNTTVYSIKVFCSMRNWGYLISAFFAALLIASPVPLRRKLIAGTVGLLLVQLFVLFRIGVDVEFSFQQNEKLNVLDYGGFWEDVIIGMDAFFAKNIVIAFAVPLIIWILVTFKKGDLKALTGFGNAQST